MYYFFFSNSLKRRPSSTDGAVLPSQGNYGIHVIMHSKEEVGPENYKKIFQTYQKLVPGFSIPENLETSAHSLFEDTVLLFDSLEKLQEFVVQFLKDCGDSSARIVAMTQYNQALQQSGHISQIASNVHSLSDEIINSEYRESSSLLHKIFK
ncbi:MAG: hypothetical protein A2X86_06600 [Bdellovibrionales bacterium GWA2_49_15]|nr:MAG: hypothetical protein A2X86_06600 [Bdellovibrionales bacterium GWA2_49_15]HAZ12058.1 hypothetical protein [Bdellovibrionales bacterium]